MKGLYWLVLGLCVWFIPYILLQSIETPENPEESTKELLYTLPQEFIFAHFGIAVVIMIKAVITIRKERKYSRTKDSRKGQKRS